MCRKQEGLFGPANSRPDGQKFALILNSNLYLILNFNFNLINHHFIFHILYFYLIRYFHIHFFHINFFLCWIWIWGGNFWCLRGFGFKKCWSNKNRVKERDFSGFRRTVKFRPLNGYSLNVPKSCFRVLL